MATFFTKQEARTAAQGAQSYRTTAASVLQESVDNARDYQTFDVFLSHASRDAELVLGVMRLLERQGLSVYVDWIVDTQLDRSKVTRDTADVLRKRMGQCRSMIFMATDNASSSKWMPWELGYFDGLKSQNIAILPLVERETDSFQGQEYLGLYPVVEKDKYGAGISEIVVKDQGSRWKPLKAFTGGQTTWNYVR